MGLSNNIIPFLHVDYRQSPMNRHFDSYNGIL